MNSSASVLEHFVLENHSLCKGWYYGLKTLPESHIVEIKDLLYEMTELLFSFYKAFTLPFIEF